MTALASGSGREFERWTYHLFPLKNGTKAWRGGAACIDLTTGKVVPATGTTNLLHIGRFERDADASGGEVFVNVNLGMEIEVMWWANDTVAPATAADIGKTAYFIDDQTVSIDGTGRSICGRIWAVNTAAKLVAVQKVNPAP